MPAQNTIKTRMLDRTGFELIVSAVSPAKAATLFAGSIILFALASGWIPGTDTMWQADQPALPGIIKFMSILGVLCAVPMLALHITRARVKNETLRTGMPLKAEVLQLQRAISQDLMQRDLFMLRFRYTAPDGTIVTRQTSAMDWGKLMHLNRGDTIDIRIDHSAPDLGFWVGER